MIQSFFRLTGAGPRCQDRAETHRLGDAIVAVVADGAGGTFGGAAAADEALAQVRRKLATGDEVHDPARWAELLLACGRALETGAIGQTTAVVIAIEGGEICGASVGDSEAWLIRGATKIDLTKGQPRKPLLGGGITAPHTISERWQPGDRIVIGTDGLFKYAPAERIAAIVAGAKLGLEQICDQLLAAVQLHNGSLQDDVGICVLQQDPALKAPR